MNIERYIEEGRQIVETYCKSESDEENEPRMFPPAPNLSPYIDKFQEHVELTEGNLDDKQHQENYEAEVTVYRALEGLEENIFVLHSFDYTRGQYKLFEGQKCKKKDSPDNKEGECDFLVIGKNYFVIIEVKDMKNVGEVIPCEPEFHLCQLDENLTYPGCNREKQINALTGTFNKSYKQRDKTKNLIKNIIHRVGGEKNTPILHFSAFPNFKKEFKDEFELDEKKKKGIIFKEDLDCIVNWWKDNVTDPVSVSRPVNASCHMIYSVESHVMLALWCYEKKGGRYNYIKTKFCLRECIIKTDEQLREGLITQEREGTNIARFKNQAVIPAPQIIKEYLKVQNLTNQQHQVFSSKQKLLWINGPAGSGKTIIILAKIIELAKSEPKKKIVVFKPGPSPYYLETLKKAGVIAKEVILNTKTFDYGQKYVQEEISCYTGQVVLVQFVLNLITSNESEDAYWEGLCPSGEEAINAIIINVVNDCHVFIDDAQALFRGTYYVHSPELDELFITLSNPDPPPPPTTTTTTITTTTTTSTTTTTATTTTTTTSTTTSTTITTTSSSSMVWCACDFVQVVRHPSRAYDEFGKKILQRELSPEHLITLSTNLRSTCDISNMMSVIRDNYINITNIRRNTRINDLLAPHEYSGHFIYGPKPVIHVVYGHQYEERISQIVEKELHKLCDQSDVGNHNINIGLIIPVPEKYDFIPRLGHITAKLQNLDIVKRGYIEVELDRDDRDRYSYSIEWPAVVVVSHLRGNVDREWLSRMYLSLSRGRVYCSAILIADPSQQNHDFLDRLKSVACIKHHHIKHPSEVPPRPSYH